MELYHYCRYITGIGQTPRRFGSARETRMHENGTKPYEAMTLRLPPETHAELRATARRDGLTQVGFIRQALRRALDQAQREPERAA